jgi:hypothetical protein
LVIDFFHWEVYSNQLNVILNWKIFLDVSSFVLMKEKKNLYDFNGQWPFSLLFIILTNWIWFVGGINQWDRRRAIVLFPLYRHNNWSIMTTLDDRLLGEKLQNYCSSSEDEHGKCFDCDKDCEVHLLI